MVKNGTMMEYFEWYLPGEMIWKQHAQEAPRLAAEGITGVWISPCYKGAAGGDDVGYGVYDLYDLREFDQKGTIPTKYGTKEELLTAIQSCHENGIQVYADVVLDHMMGADGVEDVPAKQYNPSNREEQIGDKSHIIKALTHFWLPGRHKNILNLNGIGIILIPLIGMKKQKRKLFSNFMEKTGKKM